MAGSRKGRYPPEYRERLVELVRAGRSPASLAREFEPSEQTIQNWVKQADLDEGRYNTRRLHSALGYTSPANYNQPSVKAGQVQGHRSAENDYGRSPSPEPGESAVKVINDLGDEAMKVFRVS